MERKISIHRTLNFEEVDWPAALGLLTKRFHLSFHEADKLLRQFFKKFLTPVHLYWFVNQRLRPEERQVLTAVCECYSCDVITLEHTKDLSLPFMRLQYNQTVEFDPISSTTENERGRGRFTPHIDLRIGFIKFRIASLRQAILFQCICALTALIFYVALAGILLYGLAVFLLFLWMPMDIALAATRHGSIGLGLIGILVAIAAVCGRAATNLILLARRRLKGCRP